MYRMNIYTQWERERVGWFGRMALKHVYYHVRIESPVYVRCRIQHAWGWCMGMTERDVVGREVEGGFMFGIACTPVVDSCQCIIFNGCIILHCVYVPLLSYPFMCCWTSRLLPCPGYYKQCCDEHWGTHVSFNSGFLGVYAQQWDCWVLWQFYFQFLKESPHCSP